MSRLKELNILLAILKLAASLFLEKSGRPKIRNLNIDFGGMKTHRPTTDRL